MKEKTSSRSAFSYVKHEVMSGHSAKSVCVVYDVRKAPIHNLLIPFRKLEVLNGKPHIQKGVKRFAVVWSHQLTSDLKRCSLCLEMLALVKSESCFGAYVCHRRPAGLHHDQRSCEMFVCHRGHYVGLSRCRLVGSCVLRGKDFFTQAYM